MEEQLSLLIELQDIDGKIRTHQDEKKHLPDQLAALEQKIAANKTELDKANEALAAAQKAKRERDSDLEQGGQKVERMKARTSEIKNNKEYQAHLKEIDAAEQEAKAIEDDILKLMEKIDAASAEIKTTETRAAEDAASVEVEKKHLEENLARIEGELAAEVRSRGEVASRIDPVSLAQYEKRYKSLGGKVVVEARGESCSGCYMSIPPQIFVNVKKNTELISCPNCHRILYYKEALAPKIA